VSASLLPEFAGGAYNRFILDHFRNPRNNRALDPADFSAEDVNPLCGDEIRIDVRARADRVDEIAFSGHGCAVSIASASILTEVVREMTLDQAKSLTREAFLERVGITLNPARQMCALLPLKVLKAGIGGAPDNP
jgi:nitrogen fixation NifU-like protein